MSSINHPLSQGKGILDMLVTPDAYDGNAELNCLTYFPGNPIRLLSKHIGCINQCLLGGEG